MSCQFALALMFGILLAEYGSWQIGLLAAIPAIAVLLPQCKRRNYRECVLRGALFLTAGALGAGCYERQMDSWEKETQLLLCGQQLEVCGTLIRKEQKNERWQLTLALPGYENRVVVSSQDGGYPLDGVLSVKGLVREFNSPRNEGQFNEKQFYKCKKTIGRMSAATIDCIRAPSGVYAWREKLYLFRMRLCSVFEACMPEQEAGILSTMATGEKAFLDGSVRALFQRVGISHMLAISGMHISMIGMGIYTLLRKGMHSYVCCGLLTASMIVSYGTMIGMGVSASRAIGMFLIYLIAQCVGRGYDTCSALAVLVSLLLVENPFLLHDVSFQFSFLAVFAVVTAAMVLPGKEDGRRLYYMVYPVYMALLLQLFTLPLVAYYYYEVPVYAIFINLLLLPYLGVVLGAGLIGGCVGCVGSFFTACARFLLLPCRIILSVYIYVCGIVEKWPFSSVICGQPSERKLWVYYSLLAGVLLVLEHEKRRRAACRGEEKKGTKGSCCFLFGGSMLLFALLLHAPAGGFEIDYLDVGQGDGSMLRTDEGVVCFVDGGSTDVSKVGAYRILPFLKSKGIRKVDYWILSHLDEDHVNGFYEVLESGYPIGTVVVSERMPEDEAKAYLEHMLAQYEVPLVTVCAGEVMQMQKRGAADGFFVGKKEKPDRGTAGHDPGAKLRFLSPDKTTPVYDGNGASLVFLYEDVHVRALWTGDIGADQEKWMLANGGLSEIDLYKAAHHGSKYSNTEEYLKVLSPKLSIISCGEHNRYGHPGAEAIEHMEEAGSRIFSTMDCGQIKVGRDKEARLLE
ncbi:MAG: DNA internalization-related competence protein ComEC/Rec2 [Lachnospiraceae bacterium]|nr:DNA internalization-related competence protein ComEC/Rec2 [Lachnospiraceae bacterium]